MENIGFIILRITILAFLIVLGSLLYNWIKDNKLKIKEFGKDLLLLITFGIFVLLMALYWGWVAYNVWQGH